MPAYNFSGFAKIKKFSPDILKKRKIQYKYADGLAGRGGCKTLPYKLVYCKILEHYLSMEITCILFRIQITI